MYRATGVAGDGNPQGCAVGERRPMLIFVAGYRNDYDWDAAAKAARAQGWGEIEFGKAGQVTSEHIARQDATLRASFRDALEAGSSVVVYAAAES